MSDDAKKVTPLDLITAQAAALRQMALAIQQGCEALIIAVEAIEMRPVGVEGAPSVPFLMGAAGPARPATAPADPPAIPAQGGGVRPFLTFDGPVAVPVAPTPVPVTDVRIAPDASGDIRPIPNEAP